MRMGIISEEQLLRAMAEQRARADGSRMGKVLQDMGLATPKQIAQAVTHQNSIRNGKRVQTMTAIVTARAEAGIARLQAKLGTA
jgi:hypothetical protein